MNEFNLKILNPESVQIDDYLFYDRINADQCLELTLAVLDKNLVADNKIIHNYIFSITDVAAVCELILNSFNEEQYSFTYRKNNLQTQFSLYNNITRSDINLSFEDLLSSFFTRSIDNYLELSDEIPDRNSMPDDDYRRYIEFISSQDIYEFSFASQPKVRFYRNSLIFLLISLLLLCFIRGFDLWLLVASGMLWLPGLILHLQYYLQGVNTSISINKAEQTVLINRKNKSHQFRFHQIKEASRFYNPKTKTAWNHYSYLILELHNGEIIRISCYVADPSLLCDILMIRCKEIKSSFPDI